MQTCFRAERLGLLDRCLVWIGKYFSTFQKNVKPSSAWLWGSFKISGRNYPTTRRKT